ncbi:MAG: alginate lyase family protein [Armatimonadota bacterium]|nr:MAG: alginate lyase family protein [Armatimonadota bacterium]
MRDGAGGPGTPLRAASPATGSLASARSRAVFALALVLISGLAVSTFAKEQHVTGPRITDEEFITALDFTRPELGAVKQAADAGDLARARSEFVRHLKQRRGPRWRFDWRGRPDVRLPAAGGSEGWDYFAAFLDVDWQGWKLVRFEKSDFAASRQPIGWHWIRSVAFNASGWDLTPDPEMELSFDDIRLVGPEASALICDFEDERAAWSGLQLTDEMARSGAHSGRWRYPHLARRVSTSAVPRDWSRFDALEFWAYSPRPTNARVILVLDSDLPDTSAADRILERELTSVGVSHRFEGEVDWTLNPINYNEWPWQLNRHPFWRTLGQAYWDTGDERYAREFTAQMTHWVRSQPVPVEGFRNREAAWRTIETGIRLAGSWMDSFHYFLSSPSFTDDAVVTMLKSVVEQARHLVAHPTSGNWLAMECNGLFHVGVMFPEFTEADSWRRTAVERAYAELDRQVYPDGAQIELSTGYHQVTLRNFKGMIDLAGLSDTALPADFTAKLEKMYHYNAYAAMPNGCLPALNDAGVTDVRYALLDALRYFPHRRDFEYIATGGAGGEAPAHLSYRFPYAGHLVMRSGWEPDARYLLFDAGPFGYGHQHEDKLTFVLYAHGRRHIVDAGNYPYDSSQWRRYVLSTRAHNTVMVDGLEQNRRGAPNRWHYVVSEPLPQRWVSEDDFDYAAATYDEGYGPGKTTPASHRRHVFFVKPDYWLIVDELQSRDEKPHRYDAIFHVDTDELQVGDAPLLTLTRNQEGPNLALWAVGSRDVSLDVVSGQEQPEVQGWIPSGGYDVRPIPTPILGTEGDGAVWAAYLLYPLAAGQELPVQRFAAPTASGRGEAFAVEVSFTDGRRDVLLIGREGASSVKAAGVETAGDIGFIRLNPDRTVRSSLALRGDDVRRGEQALYGPP